MITFSRFSCIYFDFDCVQNKQTDIYEKIKYKKSEELENMVEILKYHSHSSGLRCTFHFFTISLPHSCNFLFFLHHHFGKNHCQTVKSFQRNNNNPLYILIESLKNEIQTISNPHILYGTVRNHALNQYFTETP